MMKSEEKVNKKGEKVKGKSSPETMLVPQRTKRSSGIKPFFLCDNRAYFLGIDKTGEITKGSKDRFDAAAELHKRYLENNDAPIAKAIINFFDNWNVDEALENEKIKAILEDSEKAKNFVTGNFVFKLDTEYAHKNKQIKEIWQKELDKSSENPSEVCLIKGGIAPIERIHPNIKGIMGGQSAGCALVSINKGRKAFESYGKEDAQGYNAYISEEVAFKYTTMLNYLITNKRQKMLLGSDTLVFWSKSFEAEYSEVFKVPIGSIVNPKEPEQDKLTDIMGLLAKGELPYNLDFDEPFYLLGLSPNSARLSVRFFLEKEFGSLMINLGKHIERLKIIKPSWEDADRTVYIYEIGLLTINPKSKGASPVADLMTELFKAIIEDRPYPALLLSQIIIRIRATQDEGKNFKITWKKVAILKAYLLKFNEEKYKEVLTVSLNKETNDTPYVLGRMFSVLENIQETAIQTSTIKDHFNGAAATPSLVFARLLKLSQHHLKVLKRDMPGAYINFNKQLQELMEKMDTTFPKQLTLEEQGTFIIGYYHETQQRYIKKEETTTKENENE